MNRKYLSAGHEFTNTDEKKKKIASAIEKLQWFDLPASKLPFSQGYALKEMILQIGNNPDKIAYGIFDNGMTLLAMRNNYSDGEIRRATLYAIDNGVSVISVAVDEETTEDIINDKAAASI